MRERWKEEGREGERGDREREKGRERGGCRRGGEIKRPMIRRIGWMGERENALDVAVVAAVGGSVSAALTWRVKGQLLC